MVLALLVPRCSSRPSSGAAAPIAANVPSVVLNTVRQTSPRVESRATCSLRNASSRIRQADADARLLSAGKRRRWPEKREERSACEVGQSLRYRGAVVVVVERVVVPPNGSVSIFVWVSELPSTPFS
jgi:hypothetical protein